jgi:hypothetical protein
VPLARGWERQLDRRYGALFYDGTLNARSYRAWLDEHAVAYVALPDAELDYAARDEAALIESRPAYLHQVWHDAHWRLFAVRDPAPFVTGRLTPLIPDVDGFRLIISRPGSVLVRIRWSRWWRVTAGRACVRRGPGAMTTVQAFGTQAVRVQARLTGSACRR